MKFILFQNIVSLSLSLNSHTPVMLSPTLSPSYQSPCSPDNSDSHWALQYYPLLLFVIVILFVVAEGSKPNPYDQHRRFIRHHFRRRRTDSQPQNALPSPPAPPNPARDAGSAVCDYRLEKNIDGTDCVICLEDFKLGDQCRVFLNCNHGFHKACIDRWLALDFHCPLCRGSIHGFTQV